MSIEDMRKMYAMAQLDAQYTFPTKPSSDGYYHVYVKDETKPSGRRSLKAKTLEGLKEKILKLNMKTFRELYYISQNEKLKFVKNPERLYSVQNTLVVTEQTYQRFFEDTDFEKMGVEDITKEDIEAFCYKSLITFNLTKKAFMALRGILKQTLKYAFEQYYILDNPYDRINFRKFDDMLASPTPISERVHTETEVQAILDELHLLHVAKPYLVTAWALELQILMGLRRGEVAPLKKSDIYDNYILINKEQITLKRSATNPKARDVVVRHTKNYKDRRFPITNDIARFLNDYLPIVEPYDNLFPAANENGIISNKATYKLYSRICKKLGIEHNRECMKGTHSFRRNQITRVVNATGDMVLASQMFGNSPEAIKSNYYTGYDIERGRAAMDS